MVVSSFKKMSPSWSLVLTRLELTIFQSLLMITAVNYSLRSSSRQAWSYRQEKFARPSWPGSDARKGVAWGFGPQGTCHLVKGFWDVPSFSAVQAVIALRRSLDVGQTSVTVCKETQERNDTKHCVCFCQGALAQAMATSHLLPSPDDPHEITSLLEKSRVSAQGTR